MIIRNWQDAEPQVGHGSALMWSILGKKNPQSKDEWQVMETINTLSLFKLQRGKTSKNYHKHKNVEQIHYIIRGRAQMKIDEKLYDVVEGDAVYLPPECKHQITNNSNDWVEYLIFDGIIDK